MGKGYTTMPDWMLDLDLDINETIVFAVIYGFSQDGESAFIGSQNYLAYKAKCSRRTIARILDRLVKKRLIWKTCRVVMNVKYCEYRVCTAVIGCDTMTQGGYDTVTHNNIDNRNTISSIKRKIDKENFVAPTFEEVAAYCKERGNNIDAQAFIDHYESNGWMVGKVRMKSWQAAVRSWESRRKEYEQRDINNRRGLTVDSGTITAEDYPTSL